jgi:hypothetical protein
MPISLASQEAEAGDCKFEASLGKCSKILFKKQNTKNPTKVLRV